MKLIELNNTEHVSSLVFGCEPLGGTDWGKVDIKKIEEAIYQAIEHGVNFFDTSDVYGLGQSEINLSRILSKKRHDVFIATKGGVRWEKHRDCRAQTFKDSSPRYLEKALNDSLTRLRLDYIPLYFINWPDPKTSITETFSFLAQCQRQGKIKYIGACNFNVAQLKEALSVCQIDFLQTQYSFIDRMIEHNVLPFCLQHNIYVQAWGPLSQGLLTGKYDSMSTFDSSDRRFRLPKFQGNDLIENLKKVATLKKIALKNHKTTGKVALKWILQNEKVNFLITGIKSSEQLQENIDIFDWYLEADDLRQLNETIF